MVSAKEIAELKEQYEALTKRSIDLDDYPGPLFQLVFEIITADTFVAGISSKILDGDPIEPEERVVLANPLLERERWWKSEDGQLIDLQEYRELREYALGLERLRQKSNQVLR